MARALLISPSYFLLLIFLIFSCTTYGVLGEEYKYVKRVNSKKMKMLKPKTTHFRVYWHDIVTGSNATSVAVVKSVSNSSTYFGMITVIDDFLTIGPNLSSKTVGRAEGLYASAGQQETSLLMAMNFAFSDGKYNGSTITILGRNHVADEVREMPIVGGSGLFRFARGYVEARSYELSSNGNAIVEYNCYIIHY